MRPSPQETVDLVTFTEGNLNEKLHFLRSAASISFLHPIEMGLKEQLNFKICTKIKAKEVCPFKLKNMKYSLNIKSSSNIKYIK